MKKFILILTIISSLFLVGCNNNIEKDDNMNDNNSIESNINNENEQEIVNISTIEINGVAYKDINSILDNDFNFNNNYVYAEPINENGERYIKISNDFVINEERKEIEKIEILPSKIYTSDAESNYVFNYKDETYYIPVEKCESGKDRIVYRNYGIELLKENDSIKINDSVVNDVIIGWDLRDSSNYNGELRFDDVSLCEAFLESWKITKEDVINYSETSLNEYIKRTSDYTHIYQVDFDDDSESVELIYSSGIEDHVHIDSTYPTYSIISYTKDDGAKIASNDNEMLWFNNILNYKNVFYGYGAFEIGKIDNVICINENVITGYYIYDKELGLIKVNRFANGERLDNDGIEKLSKIALTLDSVHTVKTDEEGNKYIDAFPMYDNDYLFDEETGEYKLNPNSIYIEGGTKINIINIGADGYMIEFKTENGERYVLNYYYI